MSKSIPWRAAIAAVITVAAIGAAAMVPRPVKKTVDFQLDTVVPKEFGGWRIDPSIVPVSPAPDVQAQLNLLYEQILARTYVNRNGQRVMLSIAYGGDQRDALRSHKQEVCYRAQGFAVRSLTVADAKVNGREIPVTRFDAVKAGRQEPVTYWMTMGRDVITSRGERLLAQIEQGVVEGAVPDGMLVRISSFDADPSAAHKLHLAFADELLRAMSPDAAHRLTGR